MTIQLRQKISQLRSATLQGNDETARECEAHFGMALRRIVRRVVRTGRTRDGLSTTILEQVRQVRTHRPELDRDDLVAEVTSRLCALLVGQNNGHRIDTITAGGDATAIVA